MFQRVLEFVSAAADKFFRRVHGDFIGGLDVIAGLFRGMAVDADLPGKNQAFGAFAAVAEGALDERLVQSGHGQNRVPLVKTRFWISRKLCRKTSFSATAFSTSCLSRKISELLMTAWTLFLNASIGVKV